MRRFAAAGATAATTARSPVENGHDVALFVRADIGTADGVANVVREAGIENFRLHDLRHTFASRLAMKGVDLNSIRELMGHKTLAMTLRYAPLSQTHLHQAVKQPDDGGSFGGSTSDHSRAPRGTHTAHKSPKSSSGPRLAYMRRQIPKLDVAGSIPVARSLKAPPLGLFLWSNTESAVAAARSAWETCRMGRRNPNAAHDLSPLAAKAHRLNGAPGSCPGPRRGSRSSPRDRVSVSSAESRVKPDGQKQLGGDGVSVARPLKI